MEARGGYEDAWDEDDGWDPLEGGGGSGGK